MSSHPHPHPDSSLGALGAGSGGSASPVHPPLPRLRRSEEVFPHGYPVPVPTGVGFLGEGSLTDDSEGRPYVLAPGDDIPSAQPNLYGLWDGTFVFASPSSQASQVNLSPQAPTPRIEASAAVGLQTPPSPHHAPAPAPALGSLSLGPLTPPASPAAVLSAGFSTPPPRPAVAGPLRCALSLPIRAGFHAEALPAPRPRGVENRYGARGGAGVGRVFSFFDASRQSPGDGSGAPGEPSA